MESITVYISVVAAALASALFVWNIILHKKLKKLSLGKNIASLEEIIIETNNLVKKHQKKLALHQANIQKLEESNNTKLSNLGLVKFDALQNTGGKQSFALALLNKHKDGMILSSMYTRDRMSVFAKSISAGTSSQKLTQEEELAITQAFLSETK